MGWFSRKKTKSPEEMKRLVVGLTAPIDGVDPRRTQDFGTVMLLTQVFEPPFLGKGGGEAPEPLLFAEPLVDEGDARAFSAAVKKGVRFSDGTELTATHVADSLWQTDVVRAAVEEVSARGNRVVMRLRDRDPGFALTLSQSYCGIVLEKDGQLLGTGPFALGTVGDGELTLVRNERFREEVPLDEVVCRVMPPGADGRPSALLAALESGEVDLSSVLSREDVAGLREVRKHFLPGASTAILYLNCERPPLDRVELRRAIGAAIDRVEVTRSSYSNALAFSATSLLPPMMGSFDDGLSPNPERARQLVEEAGGAPDRRLRLLLVWGPRPYLPHPKLAADIIARQLGALGIEIEVVPTSDPTEYGRQVRDGGYDLLLAGWMADTADPLDYLEASLSSQHVPSAAASSAGRANRSRWKDAEMDRLLTRYRGERSEEARAAIVRRVGQEVPLVPLMYGPIVIVHSWRVHNFEPSPIGLPSFAGLDVGPA